MVEKTYHDIVLGWVTAWEILCSRFLGKMWEQTFVAQWIRLLTANQRIVGLSPAKVKDMTEANF